MQKFIKLTKYTDGEPVYINPAQIVSIVTFDPVDSEQPGQRRTVIAVCGGDGDWSVEETPEQIVLLCGAIVVEIVGDAAVELVCRFVPSR